MTTIEPSSLSLPDTQESSSVKPTHRAKRQLRFNSIGTRLFVRVMGGALVGLGSMSFFFYQELEKQATTEISDILKTEVIAIESKLAPVKQSMQNLAGSAQVLSSKGVKDPEVYNTLILDFFLKRPPLAMGVGLGQTPFGIISDRKWYYTYYYLDQKQPNQPGKPLPPPNEKVFQVDVFQQDNYPTQDYYKLPVAAGKEIWLEPYPWHGISMTTFNGMLFDRQHKVLGIANIDVNVAALSSQIKRDVIRNQGYFTLISEQGKLLSYPPNPALANARESYQTVPELKAIWSKLQQNQSGLLRTHGKFWAYQRLPSTNWLVMAVVPESVVLAPVLTITLAGAFGASVLLAAIVLLFVRYLNRRLQPILDECNKLAQADAQTKAHLQQQDEIERLSTSFYNLLRQVAINEEEIRQEVARSVQTQEELKLATQMQQEGMALQAEVEHILDVVSAVETGDLTVQAQVSDRATGLVADTLNRLIEELSRIMFAVLSTAEQVTRGAEELEQLAVCVAEQAQQQTRSVSDVQALMVNFNDLSQSTAQQAVVSDEAVEQAQVAVTQGQQEMATMTLEIEVLQKGTEQIVKRTEMLTNFVGLAASFAKDQKRVAALTRVLALNASMIANRASGQEDPEQFASVAREFETVASQVNDLALQTNQSLLLLQQRTDQIQTVVSGINQDVVDISNSVNQFIVSVDQSRHVFDNIKTVTNRVAEVGQQVTQSSIAIATTAQSTLRSIQDIAAVAAQTEQDSRFTREQAGLMDQLARTLLERVRFFRLSADPSTINLAPNQYQQLSQGKTSVGSD